MRKQDRIANSAQPGRPQQQPDQRDQETEPKHTEQVKGSASPDHPGQPKTQRQPGRLPLPD